VGHRLLGGGDQIVLDDKAVGPAVAEDERDLLGGQHEVDRHQHHPGASRRERENGVLPAVVRKQRDSIAGCKAVVPQSCRGSVDEFVEFREGQLDITVDDGRLVGIPTCGASRDVAQ